jgi:hypothetical protein
MSSQPLIIPIHRAIISIQTIIRISISHTLIITDLTRSITIIDCIINISIIAIILGIIAVPIITIVPTRITTIIIQDITTPAVIIILGIMIKQRIKHGKPLTSSNKLKPSSSG